MICPRRVKTAREGADSRDEINARNGPLPRLKRADLLRKLHAQARFHLREGYGLAQLRADALAGLTVAIVALPLSMAIAIASGAKPEKGCSRR